jgi:hypothetical protein
VTPAEQLLVFAAAVGIPTAVAIVWIGWGFLRWLRYWRVISWRDFSRDYL